MGIFDRLTSWLDGGHAPKTGVSGQNVQAFSSYSLDDPALIEFLRGGLGNAAGAALNKRTVLRNSAVWRCVNLISNSIGMLPLHLMRKGSNSGDRMKADNHPLFEILATRPNGWQTAFEFRRLMQHRALVDGNAYALVVRTLSRVTSLVPLDPAKVTPKQRDDWSVFYEYRRGDGGMSTFEARDIFHLRGPSECGIKGMALVEYAGEVLGLSIKAQEAAARIFSQGMMAGGALHTDQKLSQEAIDHLKASMAERYSGAENVGKAMVLEQGLKYQAIASTAKDAQNIETRAHQIEEIARIFGVPRPFLMVDDTSWGTGIEQLGIFFVQYGLAPWFVAWEQAISRTLLTDVERRDHYAKFNERALLRGSMKDQAEFMAKMLGSGGSPQVYEVNEVRDLTDMPPHVDGSGLSAGTGATNAPLAAT